VSSVIKADVSTKFIPDSSLIFLSSRLHEWCWQTNKQTGVVSSGKRYKELGSVLHELMQDQVRSPTVEEDPKRIGDDLEMI
jgi:hypothetical protein